MITAQTRMTRQRRIILEELRGTRSHPTAEEIHAMVKARLPKISLGTVYRNLDFLTASGDIQQINSGGTIRRFDGEMQPHYHVRCLVCGRVGDVAVSGFEPPALENLRPEAEAFTVLGSRLEFEGYCHRCQGQGKAEAEPLDALSTA